MKNDPRKATHGESPMHGSSPGKPARNEAPLSGSDVPEQDGSEDPGVGLEPTRDAGLKIGQRKDHRH